ncbi:hypothetical protein OAQ99_00065 [Candidatus Kapabacteria bacterium]|nr:hypothetical protein [Candidatus Kapabacteria bacterium]
MAKKKPDIDPEEKAREKERLERIKKEEKELKKKAKEKEQRAKDRQKRIHKKEQAEEKRIRRKVNFPIKLLFNSSFFITLVSFVLMFFGGEMEELKAIYTSGLIFIFTFFGVGLVLILMYYMQSEERIVEMETKRKIEEKEENERLKQEEEELERLLKEEIDDRHYDDNENQSSSSGAPILLDESSSAEEIDGLGDLDNLIMDEDPDVNQVVEQNQDEELMVGNENNESDPELNESQNNNQDESLSNEVGPDPFFSEDDFMNEVVFGSDDDK